MSTGLLTLVAVALVMSVVGSFAPVFPGEAFIAVVAVANPLPDTIAVALAVAVGQTVGKALTFALARAAFTGLARPPAPMVGSVMPRGRSWPALDRAHASAVAVRARGGVSVRVGAWWVPVRRSLARLHTWADASMAGRAALPVVLLSATIGLPPLLAVTLYASRSPMRLATFAACCASGRTLRTLAVAAAALSVAA